MAHLLMTLMGKDTDAAHASTKGPRVMLDVPTEGIGAAGIIRDTGDTCRPQGAGVHGNTFHVGDSKSKTRGQRTPKNNTGHFFLPATFMI